MFSSSLCTCDQNVWWENIIEPKISYFADIQQTDEADILTADKEQTDLQQIGSRQTNSIQESRQSVATNRGHETGGQQTDIKESSQTEIRQTCNTRRVDIQ